MTDFKTERGAALQACRSGNMRRVAFAASDYRYAMLHPEWAAENGSVEDFHHDLILMIDLWWNDLSSETKRPTLCSKSG